MSEAIRFVLLLLGVLGSGLVAGLFFTFSNTIMKSFDRLPGSNAVLAMQAINVVIINPWFFAAFFGTALVCLALLVVAIANWSAPNALLLVAGALVYLIGSIGVTMVCNVPLNNSLAAIAKPEAAAATTWMDYSAPWTRWNHVRAIASLLTTALFAMALWRE